ncbi:MAG: DMT family transporter [Flavobacteriales bacterium]|nr:DMT family transporter [Flavobacteriales bacterium]
MSKSLLAHLAIFLANLIYGINYTVAKEVMGHYIDPFGFILLRVSGTILLIWTTALLFKNEKVASSDFKLLFLCGLSGVGINQMLFFWGLSLTSPINSSIIMVTTPLLVMVMASILLKERFHGLKITGLFLGLGGAVVLLLLRPSSGGSGNLFGDFVTFLNACFYAIYLVIVKPLMKKYHPITVMKWVFLFGLIPVIPFGFQEFMAIEWHSFPAHIIWSVLFVVVGTTFLAYLLNTYGLVNLSPSVVSAYIYLQPALAAMIAVMAGKDQLDAIKIISTLFIFAGVYLINRK